MSDDALERLQVQVAHQELAIEALNDSVLRQERLIEQLRRELDSMRERVAALQPSPVASDPRAEPPPPHY